MKINKIIITISMILAASVCVAFAFTNHNADNSIFPQEDAIVYFYSPTCPACQKFEGDFAEFQKSSLNKVIAIDTSKMSTEEKQELRSKYGLDKIPAIYVVQDGFIIKAYKGYEETISFVKNSIPVVNNF